MERFAVLLLLFCSLLVVKGTISPSFYSFIEQNYDKQTADLIARKDHGAVGSFGGGQHTAGTKTNNKPVIFVHGYLDRASTMWPVAQQFVDKFGYSEEEVYATSYGTPGPIPLQIGMRCQHVKAVRSLIQTVSSFVDTDVNVVGFSMGAPISRKAILGGKCVDTGEDLGDPLTDLVNAYVSVAGAERGAVQCASVLGVCNLINGMNCLSLFLRDINKQAGYEGKHRYVLQSTGDGVVGHRNLCFQKSSEIANATKIVTLTGVGHKDVFQKTADIQHQLVTQAEEHESSASSGTSSGSGSSSSSSSSSTHHSSSSSSTHHSSFGSSSSSSSSSSSTHHSSEMSASNSLAGQVALVSGGSRGIGRGLAVELALAGATVYVTGRDASKRDSIKSTGTLEDLAEEVKQKGGSGKIVPVFCDHTKDDEVKRLFEQIEREQNGRLDILVNNAVANVLHTVKNSGKPFYELDEEPGYTWDIYNNCGLRSYYLASTYAARLMVKRKSGLIVTIGSPGSVKHLFSALYGVQKEANDRLIAEMAFELKDTGVLAVALHPGAVETEIFKEQAVGEKPLFAGAESIYFAGRCLVKAAADREFLKQQNGKVLLTSDLSARYDIKDINGEHVKHESQARLRPLYEAMDKIHTRDLHPDA